MDVTLSLSVQNDAPSLPLEQQPLPVVRQHGQEFKIEPKQEEEAAAPDVQTSKRGRKPRAPPKSKKGAAAEVVDLTVE